MNTLLLALFLLCKPSLINTSHYFTHCGQGEACRGEIRGRAEGAGAGGKGSGGEATGAEETADGDGGRADSTASGAQAERTGE